MQKFNIGLTNMHDALSMIVLGSGGFFGQFFENIKYRKKKKLYENLTKNRKKRDDVSGTIS